MNNHGLSLMQHRQAAHDIPLVYLLLAHHSTLIFAAYDPTICQRHPLANAARTATEAMEELKRKIYEQAAKEYPGADWLEEYTKEYNGEAWPPRITEKETDK